MGLQLRRIRHKLQAMGLQQHQGLIRRQRQYLTRLQVRQQP
jgi:hypothetical protein